MARIRKFEVALYNETVRELVEAGEHHKHYSDQWADTYEEEVTAEDLPPRRCSRFIHVYPPDRGFIIVNIREIKEGDPI